MGMLRRMMIPVLSQEEDPGNGTAFRPEFGGAEPG